MIGNTALDEALQEPHPMFWGTEETMKRKREIADILRENGKPIIISIAILSFRFSWFFSIGHFQWNRLRVGEGS